MFKSHVSLMSAWLRAKALFNELVHVLVLDE